VIGDISFDQAARNRPTDLMTNMHIVYEDNFRVFPNNLIHSKFENFDV